MCSSDLEQQLDRFFVDTIRRVPVFSEASDVLLDVLNLEVDASANSHAKPQYRREARIIYMALQFDRLTMRLDAPIAASNAVTILEARYGKTEFNKIVLAALGALIAQTAGPDATLVRWLDASRQRRKEASKGGNVNAIRAANEIGRAHV